MRVGRVLESHLVVDSGQKSGFEGNDVVLVDVLAALGGHGGDFGRVDLIHFGSD